MDTLQNEMYNPKVHNSPTATEQQNKSNSSISYEDLLDKARCVLKERHDVNYGCAEAAYYVNQAGSKPKRKRRHRINTGSVKGSKKAPDSQRERELAIVQALSADVISVSSGEEGSEGGDSRLSAILERSHESYLNDDDTSDSDSEVKVGDSSSLGPDLNPRRPTMISFDSRRPTVIAPTSMHHKEVESVSVHKKKSGPAPSEDAMSVNSHNTATTCSLSTSNSTYSSAKSFQYRPNNSRRKRVSFADESVGTATGNNLVSDDDCASISGSMGESTLFSESSSLSSANSFKYRLQPTSTSSLEPPNERVPVGDDESGTSSSSEECVRTTKKAIAAKRNISSRPRSAQDLEEPSCIERKKNRRPLTMVSAQYLDEVEQIMLACGLTGGAGFTSSEEVKKIVQEYLQANKKNEHTMYKRVTGKLVCLLSYLSFWT